MTDALVLTTKGGRLIDRLVQATLKASAPKNTEKMRRKMASTRKVLEEYVVGLEHGETAREQPKGYTIVKTKHNTLIVKCTLALAPGKHLGTRNTWPEAERLGESAIARLREDAA